MALEKRLRDSEEQRTIRAIAELTDSLDGAEADSQTLSVTTTVRLLF